MRTFLFLLFRVSVEYLTPVCFPGFPQPQYRWLKDGDYLSDFSSEHFYKIQSVARGDAGRYQCIARNSVGSIISEIIPLSVACEYI